MASSKYAAYKATLKVLKYLITLKSSALQSQIIEELNLDNPYQLMYYLRKYEYVRIVKQKNIEIIKITKKGEEKILKYDFNNMEIPKPKKWDKKWRVVIFDIPNIYKPARNALVTKLKELGFRQIQKSVYLHPYPCHDEIEAIRVTYRIRNYVFLATIEEIEGQDKLRQLFKI